MFLLFQGLVINGNDLKRHLHSNMFLLFRKPYRCITTIASTFTFQYVSIISYLKQSKQTCKISFTFQYVSIISKLSLQDNKRWRNLHSNMFLLFPWQGFLHPDIRRNLHSNMFLLFPDFPPHLFHIQPVFTFQYVSIISSVCRIVQ